MSNNHHIKKMTQELERRIQRNPLLNIDTFIIPSPYIKDKAISIDREHSYVWLEEGELLGYMLAYSNVKKNHYLIYKQVTSPFGRGRGIGTSFIEHLSSQIPKGSVIYLFVWEKQIDTLEFFCNKGFSQVETIVYRNLVYHYLEAGKKDIVIQTDGKSRNKGIEEDIGKTRHDARKTLRLLSNMVEMLSVENGERIIEDINRESTTLINMLNSFRDTMQITHKVNLKELLLERIVSYIEGSSVPCKLELSLMSDRSEVRGYYVTLGRALINLVSNALDAIRESGREGLIRIKLYQEDNFQYLEICDNGIGISPDMLKVDDRNIPSFVGKTTKKTNAGEGLGTQQIYTTFGSQNIEVKPGKNHGTIWKIRFEKVVPGMDKVLVQLERRFYEFQDLWEELPISENIDRTEIIAYIWQLRKLEIFLFDIILQFSKYNNIRNIFRTVLSFLQGRISKADLKDSIDDLPSDFSSLNQWLYESALEINRRQVAIKVNLDKDAFRGALFKSYGQAYENVIIFTLDPQTGNFLATDRKLAEHLDFAPYLGKDKEDLLRGEFIGDMNNDDNPIHFGVWTISSDEDLMNKLKLMRQGARKLIEIGIHKNKKLAFYQTTYIRHTHDIDTYACSTFKEFANLDDEGLRKFIRVADDEIMDFMMLID